MSILDWLIVLAVGGYLAYLILRPKKKKCSGCCEHCGGCK